jgi:hypothetical protein
MKYEIWNMTYDRKQITTKKLLKSLVTDIQSTDE